MKNFSLVLVILIFISSSLHSAPHKPSSTINKSIIQSALTNAIHAHSSLCNWIKRTTQHISLSKINLTKIGIAAVAAGSIYGIVRLAQKIFITRRSHKTILENAQNTLEQKNSLYRPCIDILQRANERQYGNNDAYPCTINAGILFELSLNKKDVSIKDYLAQLNSSIADLEHHALLIHAYIPWIGDHTLADRKINYQMRQTEHKINEFLPYIRNLRTYFSTFQKYFEFYDIDKHVNNLLEQAHQTYTPLLNELAHIYGEDFQQVDLINQPANEDLLAILALKLGDNFDNFITTLQKTILCISNDRQALETATEAFTQIPVPEKFYITEKTIDNLLSRLEKLTGYLQHHKQFFMLLKQEIATVAKHGNGTMGFEIPAEIQGKAKYPALAYIPELEHDLNLLTQTQQNALQTYPTHCSIIADIIKHLTEQKSAFVHSEQYAHELKEQQEEQRKEAKTRELRKQAEAAACLQKEQNYIQLQQLREQQKANDLRELKLALRSGSLSQDEYQAQLGTINNRYWCKKITDAITYWFF